MVKYLDKLSTFGVVQRIPEDDILELVESSLLKEWKKGLIIQRFDSATQGLTEIVNFCERLKND